MPDPERSENGRRKFVFLVHAGSRIHARGIDSCLLSSPFNTRSEMEANKNAKDQTGHATLPSSSVIFHFREMRDAICGKQCLAFANCSWEKLVLLRSHRVIEKGLRSVTKALRSFLLFIYSSLSPCVPCNHAGAGSTLFCFLFESRKMRAAKSSDKIDCIFPNWKTTKSRRAEPLEMPRKRRTQQICKTLGFRANSGFIFSHIHIRWREVFVSLAKLDKQRQK